MLKGFLGNGAILLAAAILSGCGAASSPIASAGATVPINALPLTPEQRAGSVSFQMTTAVDALAQASSKSQTLRAAHGARDGKDFDRLDDLLYSAGETIGDYPNNPPTGKKGAELRAWMDKANNAASQSLAKLEQAETAATSLDKDGSLISSIRVAEDALRGAIQASSALK
jgi:hypothetical protein